MILDINRNLLNQKKMAYKAYRSEVKELTEKVAHLVPGIEKRKWREWDLDHIIPVRYGFANNIPPDKIAQLSNLRIIPHLENCKKGQKLLHSTKIIGIDDKFQAKRKGYKYREFMGGYYLQPVPTDNRG